MHYVIVEKETFQVPEGIHLEYADTGSNGIEIHLQKECEPKKLQEIFSTAQNNLTKMGLGTSTVISLIRSSINSKAKYYKIYSQYHTINDILATTPNSNIDYNFDYEDFGYDFNNDPDFKKTQNK